MIIGRCLEGKPYRGRLEHFFEKAIEEEKEKQ